MTMESFSPGKIIAERQRLAREVAERTMEKPTRVFNPGNAAVAGVPSKTHGIVDAARKTEAMFIRAGLLVEIDGEADTKLATEVSDRNAEARALRDQVAKLTSELERNSSDEKIALTDRIRELEAKLADVEDLRKKNVELESALAAQGAHVAELEALLAHATDPAPVVTMSEPAPTEPAPAPSGRKNG